MKVELSETQIECLRDVTRKAWQDAQHFKMMFKDDASDDRIELLHELFNLFQEAWSKEHK